QRRCRRFSSPGPIGEPPLRGLKYQGPSPRAPAMEAAEKVLDALVRLQIAQPRQIARARNAAGDPDGLLDALSRQRAWWCRPELGDRVPTLTPFQLEQVRRLGEQKAEQLARILRIGRYLLLRRIGRGGMGIVYQAWDLEKQRYVAIKRVKVA